MGAPLQSGIAYSLWIYTMTRWITRALAGLAIVSLQLASFSAAAQGIHREAPRDVKPGIITVSATPPIIAVDGKEDRFSPGVRIRDLNNMLVLTGQMAGQRYYTVYKRDPSGLVHEVWLLTPDEYKKLGGIKPGEDGIKQLIDLLNLIFAARATGSSSSR
jgi:hypothetical protein